MIRGWFSWCEKGPGSMRDSFLLLVASERSSCGIQLRAARTIVAAQHILMANLSVGVAESSGVKLG